MSAGRYYLYGGQPIRYAAMWKGRPVLGLSRVAAETRGLSDFDPDDPGLLLDPQMEWLPKRPSGQEPLDPGETGPLGFSDNEKRLGLIAAVAIGGVLLWKKFKRTR